MARTQWKHIPSRTVCPVARWERGCTCWGRGAGGDAGLGVRRSFEWREAACLGEGGEAGSTWRRGGRRAPGIGTAGEDLGSYRRVGFWGEVPTEPLRDIFSGEAPPDPPLGLSCIQQMLTVPPAGEAELRTVSHLRSMRSPSLGPWAWGVEPPPRPRPWLPGISASLFLLRRGCAEMGHGKGARGELLSR